MNTQFLCICARENEFHYLSRAEKKIERSHAQQTLFFFSFFAEKRSACLLSISSNGARLFLANRLSWSESFSCQILDLSVAEKGVRFCSDSQGSRPTARKSMRFPTCNPRDSSVSVKVGDAEEDTAIFEEDLDSGASSTSAMFRSFDVSWRRRFTRPYILPPNPQYS